MQVPKQSEQAITTSSTTNRQLQQAATRTSAVATATSRSTNYWQYQLQKAATSTSAAATATAKSTNKQHNKLQNVAVRTSARPKGANQEFVFRPNCASTFSEGCKSIANPKYSFVRKVKVIGRSSQYIFPLKKKSPTSLIFQ